MTSKPTATGSLSDLHILLVENNEDMARNIAFFLRRTGARQVETVSNMTNVKRRLGQPPAPDIAIIDFRLDGAMTGTDVALWLREQAHLQHMLRVSFSSAPPETVLRNAPDKDVYHAMLQKPIRLEKLAARLAEIVQRPPPSPSTS